MKEVIFMARGGGKKMPKGTKKPGGKKGLIC